MRPAPRAVMCVAYERNASKDQRDCADSADPVAAADPIEPIEPIDPTLPMDATEPTEPMDSTDPCDAMDSTESVDHRDQRFAMKSSWRVRQPLTIWLWPRTTTDAGCATPFSKPAGRSPSSRPTCSARQGTPTSPGFGRPSPSPAARGREPLPRLHRPWPVAEDAAAAVAAADLQYRNHKTGSVLVVIDKDAGRSTTR